MAHGFSLWPAGSKADPVWWRSLGEKSCSGHDDLEERERGTAREGDKPFQIPPQ